jgi:hypothetical protein
MGERGDASSMLIVIYSPNSLEVQVAMPQKPQDEPKRPTQQTELESDRGSAEPGDPGRIDTRPVTRGSDTPKETKREEES